MTDADALPLRALFVAVQRFNAKGDWVMSSHVAMSMMLALFPFVLFVVALAGFVSREFALAGFLSDQAAIDDVVELVFGAWPDAIEAPIVTEVTAVIARTDPNEQESVTLLPELEAIADKALAARSKEDAA